MEMRVESKGEIESRFSRLRGPWSLSFAVRIGGMLDRFYRCASRSIAAAQSS